MRSPTSERVAPSATTPDGSGRYRSVGGLQRPTREIYDRQQSNQQDPVAAVSKRPASSPPRPSAPRSRFTTTADGRKTHRRGDRGDCYPRRGRSVFVRIVAGVQDAAHQTGARQESQQRRKQTPDRVDEESPWTSFRQHSNNHAARHGQHRLANTGPPSATTPASTYAAHSWSVTDGGNITWSDSHWLVVDFGFPKQEYGTAGEDRTLRKPRGVRRVRARRLVATRCRFCSARCDRALAMRQTATLGART